jgi:outer membrane protein
MGSSGGGSVSVHELSYGMLNASVPVFSGFRIKYGIEAAQFLEQATRLDAKTQQDDVIDNTIGAYTNLYKAQVAVELVKENLRQQGQRVTDFTNMEHNGVLALNDLLKAQLQQSGTELSLMDAENNLKLARINFSLMLGLPETSELMADSSSFSASEDAGIVANWEQKALQQRTDYQSLSLQEKATSTSIRAAMGEYYPGLALTGGYVAANIPGLAVITNAMNFGVGLQYNIGSIWKTGAKVDAARARLDQVKFSEGILADGIRLQVNQAYQNYLLALRRIEVYKKAIDQANENYRISKNKYNNSLLTITDLLEADVAQLQARLNLATSRADAFAAYKKLQQVSGTLSK